MKHCMVFVQRRPQCDFCGKEAKYDVRVPMLGCWANVCEDHYEHFDCKLGLGKGQALILKEELHNAEDQDLQAVR